MIFVQHIVEIWNYIHSYSHISRKKLSLPINTLPYCSNSDTVEKGGEGGEGGREGGRGDGGRGNYLMIDDFFNQFRKYSITK